MAAGLGAQGHLRRGDDYRARALRCLRHGRRLCLHHGTQCAPAYLEDPQDPAACARSGLMRIYLLSLGAGLLVGIIYSLLNVRSPAPPVVALAGLLGILIGEQLIPVAKHMI